MTTTVAAAGDPADVPEFVDAWVLTSRISPRRVVRAAAVGADGHPVNSYPLLHPVTGRVPVTPWAVHLADREGRLHLLCADLDATTSAQDADRDATLLSGLLAELGMPHVVCASGPTGGRHVWLGMREPVDAELVGVLARLLKAWLPTLDVSPLVNPASGCVRPPGSPHRLGGTARVLSGSVTSLLDPAVTADQVRSLVARLAEHVNTKRPTAHEGRRPITVTGGHPHLSGVRRSLMPTCRALLDVTPSGDCSATLWRILCAAAVAHWQYTDLENLIDAPGLEHARTMRCGAIRAPRPPTGAASPSSLLRRQWSRAVQAMASATAEPAWVGEDSTFDGRAEVVAAVVRAVQGRADATPGRWRGRGGLAQRRVLDALCAFQLQAVRPDDVEADIRRLALACGIDRETARRALLALAGDGWTCRTHPSVGRRGARWTIDPAGGIHTRILQTLSQADPRPTGAGAAQRSTLLATLTDRLEASAHDAFAPTGGLGLEAGSLYGRLGEPWDAVTLSRLMGCPIDTTLTQLGQLAAAGLVVRGEVCWQRAEPDKLEQVAGDLGTTGRGQERADSYAVERAAWAWWLDELDWMRAPRRVSRKPRRCRPTHPRRPDGRADYAAARALVRTVTARRVDSSRNPEVRTARTPSTRPGSGRRAPARRDARTGEPGPLVAERHASQRVRSDGVG